MANSLYPSYVRIDYHSVWGRHNHTIPTRQWNPAIGAHGLGGYTNWLNTGVEADDMINALIAAFVANADTGITFDAWTIFNFTSPVTPPHPVHRTALSSVGAHAYLERVKAQQQTFTAYTDPGFGVAKIVLLDSDSANTDAPFRYSDCSATEKAIFDTWGSPSWAWAGRNNERPAELRTMIGKPNDKLRKEYGMA